MIFDYFEVWGKKWKGLLRIIAFEVRKRTALFITNCPVWKIFHKKKKLNSSFIIALIC